MEKILNKYQRELLWGKPIVYKGVTVYPVEMADAYDFQISSTALTFNQMTYPNTNLAFKPRLNFLIEMGRIASSSKNEMCLESQLWTCFCHLLSLSFKTDKFSFYDPNNPNRKILSVTYETETDSGNNVQTIIFGSNEFEEIRKIILELNGIEYEDEFVHKDIKDRMQRDAEIVNRSKYSPPDLEDLIDICFMYTGKDYDFISKMNLRKFNRLIQRISLYEEYKICKTGAMSGMVSFKDEIQNWMSSLNNKKDKYKGLMQKREKLLEKYNQM